MSGHGGDPAAGTVRLLIACPDAKGLVAAVSGFVAERGGNLLEAEQHTDAEHGEFSMRIEFEPGEADRDRESFLAAWEPLARAHSMQWRAAWSADRKRMAVMVGRLPHCLLDLLWRREAGELDVEIPLVISNHDALREPVEHAGIPFLHLPVTPETKPEQERLVRAALEEARVDFVVLARYMQILSPAFLEGWEQRILNIHHSFLPAFAGGDPYRRAYERGVKIIGATSHYVTAELDEGPIIAQAVTEVSHHDSVADLRRKGRDLERIVLARAVRAHAEDKILVSGNKTVVFR